jgi:hypothetical protein
MILLSISCAALREQIRLFLAGVGLSVWDGNWPGNEPSVVFNSEIDLLLSDAPIHEIMQLVQWLHADDPALKTLVISAEPEYICRALMPNPSVEFIEKPFAWRDLERKVGAMLGQAGVQDRKLSAAAVGL